jgi:hypothetical protein
MLFDSELKNRQSVIDESEQSSNEIEDDENKQFDIETLDFRIIAGEEERENEESEIEQNFVFLTQIGKYRFDSNVVR